MSDRDYLHSATASSAPTHDIPFSTAFEALTGHKPMSWQRRLFDFLRRGWLPDAIDLPTGLGKTSVMAIWLLARAFLETGSVLPRRLIYVVDRRVVVDQATAEAERIAGGLGRNGVVYDDLRERLGLQPGQNLLISTLRGGRADNREWTYDAAAPAIVIGTIDMIGSRLLFCGYRMSRWSRSMQAGLLGIDSLIVLDEAHLSPAFCKAVPRALHLQTSTSNSNLSAARFLLLSATLGESDGRRIFCLEASDHDDPIVASRTGRLKPTKRLTFIETVSAKGGLGEALAREAAGRDERAQAVLVYCDSRRDANAIADKLRRTLGKGRENDVRLITGARRGYERDDLASTDTYRAFTYESGNRATPSDGRTRFLVCTAAGEVGADLDGDTAVMDLVPLERMIQRLGRVNRRGVCAAPAPVSIYYDAAVLNRSSSEPDETKEAEAARLSATKTALQNLPALDGGGVDGSPSHLGAIGHEVHKAASTPPPEIIPTIEHEHVEAWALTSLKDHPGRPDVEPFMRGVVKEDPQTAIAWRADVGRLATLPDSKIEQALAAARLQPAEVLEAPTSEVVEVLMQRLKSLRKKWSQQKNGKPAATGPRYLLVFKGGKLAGQRALAPEGAHPNQPVRGGREIPLLEEDPKRLFGFLRDATVLLEPDIGGLKDDGALGECDARPRLHVHSNLVVRCVWPQDEENKQRVELVGAPPQLIDHYGADALRDLVPALRHRLALRRSWSARLRNETEDHEGPLLEYWKPWDIDGETSATARSQSLSEHHSWARTEMKHVARRLHLPDSLADTLTRAVAVHDLGKDRKGWQDGVGAPDDGRPYAKSDRRGSGVGTYRHEFGSVRDALYKNTAALDGLEDDLRELALHLIAAHHGRARPSIPAEDEEEIFKEVLDQDALDAALRYIRLQRRWGPWGLAWLEALLRSVDATVSRRLDQEATPVGPADIEAAR